MRSALLPPYSSAELKSAKSALLADIDQAIARAPIIYPESIGPKVCLNKVRAEDVCLCEACMNFNVWPERHVRFKALGTSYKVLNLKERLRSFKGTIDSCAGFKTLPVKGPHKSPMEKLGKPSAGYAAIRELMVGGDLTAGCTLAEQAGKRVVFEARDDARQRYPSVYGEVEAFHAEGFDGVEMVSARIFRGGSALWAVIELSTGRTLGLSQSSREKSEGHVLDRLATVDSEQFGRTLVNASKVSQETLREQWLAWAEVEEVRLVNEEEARLAKRYAGF